MNEEVKIDKRDFIFPIEIFPEHLQNYMLECNRTLDSSFDYMGASLLWVLSLIVGNAIKIQVKPGWIEGSTVWLLLVGKPGIGKTPSKDAPM